MTILAESSSVAAETVGRSSVMAGKGRQVSYVAPSTGHEIRAVLFDTFGSVVDWRSGVAREVSAFAARHGIELDASAFADAWRSRYEPSLEPVRSGTRGFVPLDQLHRENLLETMEQFGVGPVGFGDAEIDALNSAWERLDPWPDSVEGLRLLGEQVTVGPLSNANLALLLNMARRARLPWTVIVGSDATQAYKPDRRAYQAAAEMLRFEPGEVMLAAAHNHDLLAATQAGLATAFFARPTEHGPGQTTDLRAEGAWDIVCDDIIGLAHHIAEAGRSEKPSRERSRPAMAGFGRPKREAMEYVRLGSTGLEVSRLVLGCMSFGDPKRGPHEWTLDEETSRPLIRRAVEAGINFFDTANVYSAGSGEEIVGRALKEFGRRDQLVIATKVHGRMHDGPNGAGLSRKAIMTAVDASLARLGTDYIDLYQIHRWDPHTPIEETLEALHDVVKAGKARYLGASSMSAWQFSKAHYVARMGGLTPFVSMQNHYNLLNREEEREMLPLCADLGVGVIPWSPLARGRLTRDWGEQTTRSQTDEIGRDLVPHR